MGTDVRLWRGQDRETGNEWMEFEEEELVKRTLEVILAFIRHFKEE